MGRCAVAFCHAKTSESSAGRVDMPRPESVGGRIAAVSQGEGHLAPPHQNLIVRAMKATSPLGRQVSVRRITAESDESTPDVLFERSDQGRHWPYAAFGSVFGAVAIYLTVVGIRNEIANPHEIDGVAVVGGTIAVTWFSMVMGTAIYCAWLVIWNPEFLLSDRSRRDYD